MATVLVAFPIGAPRIQKNGPTGPRPYVVRLRRQLVERSVPLRTKSGFAVAESANATEEKMPAFWSSLTIAFAKSRDGSMWMRSCPQASLVVSGRSNVLTHTARGGTQPPNCRALRSGPGDHGEARQPRLPV